MVTMRPGQVHDLVPLGSPDNTVLSFASSDPNVGQVSSRGQITALKPGTATITLKVTKPGGTPTVIRLDVTVTG
jgi:uncharacterized protein YjdB